MENLQQFDEKIREIVQKLEDLGEQQTRLEEERRVIIKQYLANHLDDMVQKHPHYLEGHKIDVSHESYFDHKYNRRHGLGDSDKYGRSIPYQGPNWFNIVVCQQCDKKSESTTHEKLSQDEAEIVFKNDLTYSIANSFLEKQGIYRNRWEMIPK